MNKLDFFVFFVESISRIAQFTECEMNTNGGDMVYNLQVLAVRKNWEKYEHLVSKRVWRINHLSCSFNGLKCIIDDEPATTCSRTTIIIMYYAADTLHIIEFHCLFMTHWLSTINLTIILSGKLIRISISYLFFKG